MSSDATITQTTFFIASLVVAASLSGVIIGISYSMADEIRSKAQVTTDQLGSDITIINDPRHVPYTNDQLTLYLKNVGDTTLSHRSIIVFIDGNYISNPTIALIDNDVAWTPTTVVKVTAAIELGEGDHYAKILTSNGAEDSIMFRLW